MAETGENSLDVNFLNDRLEEINIKAPLDKLVVGGAYYGSASIKSALKKKTVKAFNSDQSVPLVNRKSR